jgi:hypothetical protein
MQDALLRTIPFVARGLGSFSRIAQTSVKENAPQMAASVVTVPSRFSHRGQIVGSSRKSIRNKRASEFQVPDGHWQPQ